MKLAQAYPLQYFNKAEFEQTDNALVMTWDSWSNSGKIEYPYDSIKQVSITASTEPQFRNWAYAFFIVAMLTAIFGKHIFVVSTLLILVLSTLVVAAILFLLSFWKVYNWVVFRDKDGNSLFAIDNRGTPEDDFIKHLKSRLGLK